MRLLATLPGMTYVLDNRGQVYLLPADGRPGNLVRYPDVEASSLRRHAAFLRRQGREPCADQWETAAVALEQQADLPEAA